MAPRVLVTRFQYFAMKICIAESIYLVTTLDSLAMICFVAKEIFSNKIVFVTVLVFRDENFCRLIGLMATKMVLSLKFVFAMTYVCCNKGELKCKLSTMNANSSQKIVLVTKYVFLLK